MADKVILVTGGAGYIGSHTCVALTQANYRPLIIDNLSNSHEITVDRLGKILGDPPIFIRADIRDEFVLEEIFEKFNVEAVMHFAASKSVGESVAQPLLYYDNNVQGTLALLKAMHKAQVKTLVFSSSATVYGQTPLIPYKENHPRSPINPYGRTKMVIEDMLSDLCQAEPDWRIACLRYFNPVGAHPSGLIGENPLQSPTNLMPIMTQVAAGIREQLLIFGNDYPTADGTCVRDYVHVMDIAGGHIAALDYLQKNTGIISINLGYGKGTSVLEIIQNFEITTGRKVSYQFVNKRAGDLPAYWAEVSLAEQILGWKAQCDMSKMCEDSWRWQKTILEKQLNTCFDPNGRVQLYSQ